ncbi:hypothetical protein E2C01_050213 [Portunus trituberculatus]|uniref:Uncharacterized protein n=1 Tax=Portunus trituberculatus TaxID=210409 RepID=A0A5B7G7N3_PORTR|nr:hypothetical protein [Portunus trituberculatus]
MYDIRWIIIGVHLLCGCNVLGDEGRRLTAWCPGCLSAFSLCFLTSFLFATWLTHGPAYRSQKIEEKLEFPVLGECVAAAEAPTRLLEFQRCLRD